MVETIQKIKKSTIYSLISPREHLVAWKKIQGLWKNRKPDPLKELKKIRRNWK